MTAERVGNYSAEGRFPESKRVLLIGPVRRTFTHITMIGERINPEDVFHSKWRAEIDVNSNNVKGKIVIERNDEDKPFELESELKNFLIKKFKITYLRDLSKPAVETEV